VVSLCRLKQCFSLHKDTTPPQPNHTVTPTHIEPEEYTHTQSQAPEDECTSIRNMLSKKNKARDISWSISIQLVSKFFGHEHNEFTSFIIIMPLPLIRRKTLSAIITTTENKNMNSMSMKTNGINM
jgi:hypothetical protein